MSLTHGAAIRNVVADAVVDAVDAGTPPGLLKIRDSSNVVLATIALATTAFGSASGGVASMSGLPKSDTSADATGTAANFIVTNAAGTTIFAGSVTATGGGGDLTLDNLSIVSGQTVTITAGSYTAPV